MVAIDTADNRVVATIPIGQAPQAIAYVPNAVSDPSAGTNLESLGLAGSAVHLAMAAGGSTGPASTSVTLFDQGLLQIVQAAVTGLAPREAYQLGLSNHPDGSGPIEPIARFHTNPAGAAIVDTTGPLRRVASDGSPETRRYLVITSEGSRVPLQVQRP